MKKYLFTALLALGATSMACAQPGIVGDLILGFKDNGTDGGSGTATNITVDLGQYSNYQMGSTAAYYSAGVTEDTGISLSSILSSTYGTGWQSDTGLLYGVVGTTSARTLFLSANATGSSLNGTADSTAWTEASSTSQSQQTSKFTTLETHQTSGAFGSIQSTGNTVSTSYSVLEAPTAGKVWGGNYATTAYEQNPVGNAADLYQLTPTNSSNVPGTFLGTFSIGSNGDLDFTAVAAVIPEPSTYAAILGVVVLGVVAVRRRKQAFAL